MPNADPPVDMSSVCLVDLLSEDVGYGHEARKLEQEARRYLLSFNWCSGIVDAYLGDEAAPHFGIFLFLIHPASPNVDRWLWVVVGDLPPAYLVCDDASTPRKAVQAYISEMSRWVAAVKCGDPIENFIPVNAEPTASNADLLANRLGLLKRHYSES